MGVFVHGFAHALVGASLLFSTAAFSSPAPRVSGEITSLSLAPIFGSAPGQDSIDASGSFQLGAGNNGMRVPQEAVIVSFDNGRFIQALPSGSFQAISGGYRYLSNNPGIREFRIMNNGTFLLEVRNINLTGSKSTEMGAFFFSVGDDSFSAIPNSVPVGKIVGPVAANVGASITLDASQSTDFNMEPLSYQWSIVSQPAGSNISLSSSTNPTTSLNCVKNGAYVIKLVPNDGKVDGIPALITITASGEELPPPAAPGPDNGLIVIDTNHTDYRVGEKATLTVTELTDPGGKNRYFFRATLNDQLLPIVKGNGNKTHYTTEPFTAAGSYTYKVVLYIEDGVLADRLQESIAYLQEDIVAVDAALTHETDSEVIARLMAQKSFDLEQITVNQEQLELNRTLVGEPAVLEFLVNP